MSKVLKIWLWFALIVCTLTTALNALSGRYLSAFIAIGSIVSLGVLLFARRRMALFTLCGFYALSFGRRYLSGNRRGHEPAARHRRIASRFRGRSRRHPPTDAWAGGDLPLTAQ